MAILTGWTLEPKWSLTVRLSRWPKAKRFNGCRSAHLALYVGAAAYISMYISMMCQYGRCARLIVASDLSRAYSLTHLANSQGVHSSPIRVPAVGPPSSERTRMLHRELHGAVVRTIMTVRNRISNAFPAFELPA